MRAPLLPLIPSLLLAFLLGSHCHRQPLQPRERGARSEGSGAELSDPTLVDDSDYVDIISLDDVDDSDKEASGEALTPAPTPAPTPVHPPLLAFHEAQRGDAAWIPTPSPRMAPGAPAQLTARGPRPHIRTGSSRSPSPSSTTSTSPSSTTSTSPPSTTFTLPRSTSTPSSAAPGPPGRRAKRPHRRRRPPGRGSANWTQPRVTPSAVPGTPTSVRPPARTPTACDAASCPLGSYCLLGEGGRTSCPCSLGKGGRQCAQDVTARVPAFSGHSFLALPTLRGAHGELNISLELKAEARAGYQNALLLFCGDREDARPRDFLALSLRRGVLTFSFDCGSGPAWISASTPVTPGSWHRVALSRSGRHGRLTVDSQPPSTGHSQGPLSHISFRTPLYVGGPPHAPLTGVAVGPPPGWGPPLSPLGFLGCVRALRINGREVDARAAPRGHAVRGANVGECGREACAAARCGQGAPCEVWDGEEALCLCSLGFSGPRCQDALAVRMPVFDARLRSYAAALWPGGLRPPSSAMELELEFRSMRSEGTLLYSDDAGAGDAGDFVALVLRGGHLEMRFDCGSGTATIRSAAPVSVGEWHVVQASRRARLGILQLDDQAPVSAIAPGSFTQIRCSSALYLGGVPDYDAVKKKSGVTAPFTGTFQRLAVNGHAVVLGPEPAGRLTTGVNVGNAATACEAAPCQQGGSCHPRGDSYICDCPLGYQGQSCQEDNGFFGANAVEDYEELPRFTGSSYISYESSNILKRVSGFRSNLFVRFKATGPDGLLLWRGGTRWGRGTEEGDYILLGLQGGALIFSYDLGSGPAHILVNSSFNDGLWHRVKAVRTGQTGKLTVDDFGAVVGRSPGHMTRLDLTGPLYLGGVRADGVSGQDRPRVSRGLEGCVSHLTLATDAHVALIAQAAAGHNVQSC
ncbi:pikachurin isoform X2 [Petromyzon marinus]|uniref:pikachurin isoform X2 n=1 Tax=Petromyzon marinus TaxID=7757 RepID=UPI003F70118D